MGKYTTPKEYDALVKSALTDYPAAIKDISIKIGKNPNIVSKYLEIMFVRNEINMVKIGNAKCYFKKRIPDDCVQISDVYE